MQPFRPLPSPRKSSVSTAVAESVREAIVMGTIAAGDRLPPERDIAAMLGVSRPTVRAALMMLEGKGLINIRHGSGVFVAAPDDADETTRRVAASLLLQKHPIWDLFEIREKLETEAAAWAARRATPRELDEMHRIFHEYEEQFEAGLLNAETANHYDNQLHRLIVIASRNEVLLHIMDNLEILLADCRKVSITAPGRLSNSVQEMARIVRAVDKGDLKAARREMQIHLANGRKALRAMQQDQH